MLWRDLAEALRAKAGPIPNHGQAARSVILPSR